MNKTKILITFLLVSLFAILINPVVSQGSGAKPVQKNRFIEVEGGRAFFTVLFPDTRVDWEYSLKGLLIGGRFEITADGETIIYCRTNGEDSDYFMAQPGVLYSVYASRGNLIGRGDPGPGHARGSVAYTDEILYDVRCSYRGIRNSFNFYLPANYPNNIINNSPLAKDGTKDINKPTDIKVRNYPIRVWYRFRAGNENSLWPVDTVKSEPFFEIHQYNPNTGLGSSLKRHQFHNSITSGYCDIPANRGIIVTLYNGCWGVSGGYGFDCWYHLIYKLDETPPNAPSNVRVDGGRVFDNKIYTNGNPVKLIWDGATDKGTTFKGFTYGPSGIKEYQIYVDGKLKGSSTKTNSELALEDGRQYRVKVKAVDNEGNEGGFSNECVIIVDLKPPKGSITIGGTNVHTYGGTKYTNSRDVQLSLSAQDNITNGVTEMRFSDDGSNYTAWETYKTTKSWTLTTSEGTKTVYVQYRDKAGNISTYSDSVILDITKPKGSISINGIVIDEKKFTNNQEVTVNFENIFDNLSSVGHYQLKNENSDWSEEWYTYKPDKSETNWPLSNGDGPKTVYVRYKDRAGNISDDSSASIELDTKGPEVTVEIMEGEYTNTRNITLKLSAEDACGAAQMQFKNEGDNYGNWEPFQTTKEWKLVGCSGKKTIYGQFKDKLGNQPIEDTVITITYDDEFPNDGGFILTEENGAPITKATNKLDIKLANIYANDNLGLQELLFWNGTVEKRPGEIYSIEPASGISEAILKKVAAGTAGISIAVSGTRVNIGEAIPWRLKDQNGEQSIIMEIRDRAGNSSNENPEKDPIIRTVFFDKKEPSAPEGFQHRHEISAAGDPVIVFTWKAKNPDDPLQDMEKFTGTCTLPNETKINIDNNISYKDITEKGERYLCGAVEIKADPKEIGFNKKVKIAVASVDAAGNISAGEPYTAWTLPRLGRLAKDEKGTWQAVAGYDWSAEKHYIRFQLQDQGEAASHLLEAGEAEEVGFPDELTMGEDNSFIHNERNGEHKANLKPRGKYKYRLVAVNGGGDRVYGDEFHYTLPNFPPGTPVPETPVDYARDGVEFRFTGTTDPDGDAVKYKVYIAEGTKPIIPPADKFTEVQPTKEIVEIDGNQVEITKFVVDKLSHGHSYAWYVEAYDGIDERGITASETVWFTVDTEPPVLTIQDAVDSYISLEQLKVAVSDALSGVKELSYQMLSVSDNSIIEVGKITIDSSGEEAITCSIPLPEGRYHLQLSVEDHAGNRTEQNLNNLYVDHTAPEIDTTNTGLLLQQVNGKYMVRPNFIPVKITVADDNSGLHRLRYWFTGIDGGDGGSGEIGLSPNVNQYTPYLHMTGENGKEYDLKIQVADRAGNESPVTKIGRVLLDGTVPEVSLTLTGLTLYDGKYYLGVAKDLEVELTAVDPESGIKETLFTIREPGVSESGWGEWENAKSHISTAGAVYQVGVKAVNGAGSETIYYSEEFIYDNDGPEILAVNLPSGELVYGETAIIGIEAYEPDSPITEYRLAVGNQEDPTLLTGRIKGNRDGWIILPGTDQNEPEPVEIRFEIPEIPDGVYTIKLEVENAAGHKAVYTQGSLNINNRIEKMIVSDQGPYSMFGDRLAGWWRYNGEKEIAGYCYRILDSDGQAVTNWAETQETETVVEGLNLLDGETYHFEVQAVYKTGGLSASGKSPGVTIDTTSPVLTKVETPEYSISKNIKFEWSGYDNESGISKVEAALSSGGYGQTDLTGGWVEVTGNPACLTTDINGERLRLNTGDHCYLTVRIINGAGLISEERAARAIIIDDTAPPEPLVIDQGVVINTNQPLQAHWIFSPVDPESGNAAYQWTILKGGESLSHADWRDSNGNMRVRLDDFQQQHGEIYYFAVKVTNGAGLSTIGMSDGILVDGSAPYIPEVRLVNAVNLGEPEPEEVNYITSNEGLGLAIYSYDPETEIVKYFYTWGARGEVDGLSRAETQENLIRLSDPELPEGEIIVFLGEGVNEAGLVSPPGYSTGVILDTQAPVVKNVRGTYSGGRLFFDWEVEPSVSPVAGYEVSLVEAGKAPSTWEKVGLRRSIEIDASGYPDGEFQLIVRAYNRAGTYSRRGGDLDEWGTSPVIPLDRTAPEITGLLYNRYVSKGLKAEVQAEDNLSGVAAYQYALGDRKNQTAFTGGWVEVLSFASRLEFSINTEELPHTAEIFLAVRAKDRVGLWSEVKVSEKIIVDHTPPDTPDITCGVYTTSDKMIGGIGFESEDPESGVTHYLLSVVKEEGGEWLTAPEPQPIESFNGTLTGLNLEDGGKYRLVMRTMNKAGLWSDPGYSTPVIVDITPPVLEFNREAEKNGELVFNLDELPKVLTYTLSEDAQVQFTLLAPNGNLKNFSEEGEAGENTVVFGDEDQYIYGIYLLFARPADLAGNLGERVYQQIRINTPPVIHLQEINTTPGKPLPLQQDGGYVSVYDPDDPDNESFHYEWNMGDGSRPKTYAEALAHYYTAPGDYTLRLTVTDDDGGASTAETTVHVRNTSQGTLYIDETWSGTHHLYGEVIVPEGVTLTIEPGARIVIERDPAGMGYDYALIVKGALVIPGGEVVIGLPDGETGLWRGIYIEGRAELNGATVKHARRGLTALESSTVNITGCIFRENEVGLHAYGSSPRIIDCSFLENTIYGIKEDKGEGSGGRPVVINCRFGGNRYDYYHQDLAVITLEELNALEGNQGNRKQ